MEAVPPGAQPTSTTPIDLASLKPHALANVNASSGIIPNWQANPVPYALGFFNEAFTSSITTVHPRAMPTMTSCEVNVGGERKRIGERTEKERERRGRWVQRQE